MLHAHNDEIDVETIMRRIRENVERRRAGPTESQYQGERDASRRGPSPLSPSWFYHYLHTLNVFQDPKPQGAVASHGSVVIKQAKGFIRRALSSYHRGIFARQAEFNANVIRGMVELASMMERSSSDFAATLEGVQAGLETLQAHHERQTANMGNQLGELAGKQVDLIRHLEEMRQETLLQKRRLDLLLSELRGKIGDERECPEKLAT
jgi:hypothetical protein